VYLVKRYCFLQAVPCSRITKLVHTIRMTLSDFERLAKNLVHRQTHGDIYILYNSCMRQTIVASGACPRPINQVRHYYSDVIGLSKIQLTKTSSKAR